MKFHFKRDTRTGLLLPPEYGVKEFESGEEPPKDPVVEEKKPRQISEEDKKKLKPMFLKKCRRCRDEFQGFNVQKFCLPCLKEMGEDKCT